MTIEIHQPELEALIQQRMASGHFQNVEEVLLAALKTSPETETSPSARRSLVEVCAMVKGLTEDLDFSRSPSSERPLDLS